MLSEALTGPRGPLQALHTWLGGASNGTTRQRDIFPLAHLDSVDVLWPGYPSPLQQRELLLYVNSVATVLNDLWGVRPGPELPSIDARPAAHCQSSMPDPQHSMRR